MSVAWLEGVRRDPMADAGNFTGGPPKGCLHTTETTSWPGYRQGRVAPHFTLMPVVSNRSVRIRQHIPMTKAGRALRNEPGGVQTNLDGVIQIELIGTCDPGSNIAAFYWPGADDWALRLLGKFMRRVEAAADIPRRAVRDWISYPDSYGERASQRLSLSKWDGYSGWLGHEHVPENSHGDPGSIDIATLMGIDGEMIDPPPVTVPDPTGTLTHPAFPLARDDYFGRSHNNGLRSSVHRASIRVWQRRMRTRGWSVDVDGIFGPQTEALARHFQRQKSLHVDGLVGRATWHAAWTEPIT